MRVQKASRKGIGGVRPKYRCPKCGAYGRTRLERHFVPDKGRLWTSGQRVYAFTCRLCKTYDTKEHFVEAARAFDPLKAIDREDY